jgi:WD40 repeat protein
LSPDGKTLAATGDADIEVRDASSGDVLRKLGIRASALAWSPDGKILAAATGKDVALCDPATGASLKTLSGPADSLAAIAWSPDGNSLAGREERPHREKSVFVWDARSGEIRLRFDPRIPSTDLLRWLRDGRTLVVASVWKWKLGFFEADSGKLVRMVDIPVHDLSPDGRVAVEGGPGMVRLWSLPEGRTICTLLCLREGRFALISPEGHFHATPGAEKELVYVVQTEKGQETLTPEEFSKRYGWKNDPEKVTLTVESSRQQLAVSGDASQAKPAEPKSNATTSPQESIAEPPPFKDRPTLKPSAPVTTPPAITPRAAASKP